MKPSFGLIYGRARLTMSIAESIVIHNLYIRKAITIVEDREIPAQQ